MRAWLETGAHGHQDLCKKSQGQPWPKSLQCLEADSGLTAYVGVVSRVRKEDAGLGGWSGGVQEEASLRQRTASGQLEPGGGDEMPFRLRQEPLICGPGSATGLQGLWAAGAGVAPGSCSQLKSGLQFFPLSSLSWNPHSYVLLFCVDSKPRARSPI